MGEHAELIARLEKVEGGSRDLDADMSIMIFDSQVKRERQILPSFVHHMGDGEWSVIPQYTTSIDAIVALIGEKLPKAGIDVSIREGWSAAEVWTTDNESVSNAKTAPIALCIAFLRALEKEGGEP